MKALLVLAVTVGALATATVSHSATPVTPSAACSYGRGQPLPEQASWAEQFRCYKSSGRHVSVPGSAFDAGTVSGGVCVLSVTPDRVQLAPCGSFSGDAAMILPYDALAYVVDDPRSDDVKLYVTALFKR